jgi:hypothetical protein
MDKKELEEIKELEKICEAEFEIFSSAISKMGFDPLGFDFMILFDAKALSRKKLLNHFNNLTEEEKVAVDNRIKLLS